MIRFIPCNKQKVQIMEEWKIGEIRQIDNEWYQCLESSSCRCDYCDYGELGDCHKIACASGERSDDKEVYFKQLEKVGKPYEHYEKFYQCYKLPMETEIRLLPNNCYPIGKDNLVEIEIKQNKEDMEIHRVVMNIDDRDYLLDRLDAILHDTHCQQYKDEVCEALSKYIITRNTSNLKPFDLNSAKAGKPVCTRDGRKARIVCFDVKGDKPIIALIEYEIDERPCNYFANGRFYSNPNENNDADLMMLPEKKEGWVNIYDDMVMYESEEEAKIGIATERNYIATTKVEWEE